LNSGDTAWSLICTGLVLLMTPGLAFFYGGLVREKNTINTMKMSFLALGVIALEWALVGYSMAFGPGGRLIGGLQWGGLGGVGDAPHATYGPTIPHLVFMAFQMMFAIITAGLISGAVAERMKFWAWLIFITVWSVVVYAPLAYWVFGGGFIFNEIAARDFAGGLVVHINAGVSALALVLVLGPRLGWRREIIRPHSLPWTMLGAGILWFGWFGFNAGSALAANELAGNAFVTTQIAAAIAATTWMLIEAARTGKPTTLGFASGAVAGLVAITPCAGFVGPFAAFCIGIAAGAICYFALQLKFMFNFDDSLDVIGVHLVGGIVGALLLGVFADAAIGGTDGVFFGNARQLWNQFASIVIGGGYAFVVSLVLAYILKMTIGLRVSEQDERRGLDLSLHEEQGYVLE